MGEKFREVLEEAAEKAKKSKPKEGKMLAKLHSLDDTIEDFIDQLEEKIIEVQDNPVFVKKAHQLLADMSKEYSEFIVALRAIVNAVDRKEKIVPAFEKTESRVRDVLDGQSNGPPENGEPEEGEEEPQDNGSDDEYELKVARKGGKKKSAVKEALEMISESDEDVAFREMSNWLKNIKQKISKSEPSIKKKNIDMNVVDLFMRMAKVDEESFFEYFWS